jgi:hypothetical protein
LLATARDDKQELIMALQVCAINLEVPWEVAVAPRCLKEKFHPAKNNKGRMYITSFL